MRDQGNLVIAKLLQVVVDFYNKLDTKIILTHSLKKFSLLNPKRFFTTK